MARLHSRSLILTCEFAFTIARNTRIDGHSVIAALTFNSPEGLPIIGLGEGVPVPFYNSFPEPSLDLLKGLEQANWADALTWDVLLNQQWPAIIAQLPATLDYQPVKVALDMACWDAFGKLKQQPLYKIWGLDPAQCPKSSYTIGLADEAMIRHKTQVALERQYDIIKVKVGGPSDVATVKLIRDMAGPNVTLRIDANAAWSAQDTEALSHSMAELGVEFIEEPFSADVPLAERIAVKSRSALPLIADESIHTLADLPSVTQWAHGINAKLTKTGGLTQTRELLLAGKEAGMKLMLGCFVESSLSVTAMAHLAPLVDYVDLDGALLTADDPVDGVTWQGSRFMLTNRPGVGVEIYPHTELAQWVQSVSPTAQHTR